MIIPKLHYKIQGKTSKKHLVNIQKACTAGAELVQLGSTRIADKKFLKLAKEAREITSHYQTRLIINSHYKIAKEVMADGVYLEKMDICPTLARKHLYAWQGIGATANTLQDCETLVSKEVDYICLGPFRISENKDTETPLGLNGYTVITEALNTETPIIGFGDITAEDVTEILRSGISGIVVSEEITRDFNNIKIFNQLLNASATAEQRHTFK